MWFVPPEDVVKANRRKLSAAVMELARPRTTACNRGWDRPPGRVAPISVRLRARLGRLDALNEVQYGLTAFLKVAADAETDFSNTAHWMVSRIKADFGRGLELIQAAQDASRVESQQWLRDGAQAVEAAAARLRAFAATEPEEPSHVTTQRATDGALAEAMVDGMPPQQADELLVTARAVGDILIQRGCQSGEWALKQSTLDYLGTPLFHVTHEKNANGEWVPIEA